MVGQTDVCPTNFMSAQALRQTEYCANDIKRRFRNKLHISANGELAQEYLRIRYMQFIEIEASHLHSTLFAVVPAQT